MTVNSFDNPDSPPTMAFKNGLSERLDELRFPSPRSPPSDSPFSGYGAMSPGHASLIAAALSRPPSDVRGNLQRRFTTDSSKLTSWSPLKSGGGQLVPDAMDLLSSVMHPRAPLGSRLCALLPGCLRYWLHTGPAIRLAVTALPRWSPVSMPGGRLTLSQRPALVSVDQDNVLTQSSSKRSVSISSTCASNDDGSKRI